MAMVTRIGRHSGNMMVHSVRENAAPDDYFKSVMKTVNDKDL